MISKIQGCESGKSKVKYDEEQYESIGPLEIYESVEKLVEECVPPISKHINKFFKVGATIEIIDDGDSMSES